MGKEDRGLGLFAFAFGFERYFACGPLHGSCTRSRGREGESRASINKRRALDYFEN